MPRESRLGASAGLYAGRRRRKEHCLSATGITIACVKAHEYQLRGLGKVHCLTCDRTAIVINTEHRSCSPIHAQRMHIPVILMSVRYAY